MQSWDTYTDAELGDYLSDYHKDVYGFRPGQSVFISRDNMIREIEELNAFMARMRSTPEGRARLKEDGWEI